jgi:hypothetical protein
MVGLAVSSSSRLTVADLSTPFDKQETHLLLSPIQCLSLRLLLLHLYYCPSFALFSLLFSSTVSSRFVAGTLRNTLLIQLDRESGLAHIKTVTIKVPSNNEPPSTWLTLHPGRKGPSRSRPNVKQSASKGLLQHKHHKDIHRKPIGQLHCHIPSSHPAPPSRSRVTFTLQSSV